MYGWIWSKIPGGKPGKIIGSLALAAGACALLWYALFPAVRPYMPWSNVPVGDSLVENEEGGDDDDPAGDESTCTSGVDCPDPGSDDEGWETAPSPEPSQDQDGDG